MSKPILIIVPTSVLSRARDFSTTRIRRLHPLLFFILIPLDGPTRHSLECILQRIREGHWIGLEFRHRPHDVAAPRAAGIARRALFDLSLQASLGRHAWRGGRGNVLLRAQDPRLRPAFDKHDIRGKSEPHVVLCPDHAHAPVAARYRIANVTVLYKIHNGGEGPNAGWSNDGQIGLKNTEVHARIRDLVMKSMACVPLTSAHATNGVI